MKGTSATARKASPSYQCLLVRVAAVLLAISLSLGLLPGGCGRGNGRPLLGKDLPTLVRGKLTVGTHPNFPPFESLEGGKWWVSMWT